MNVEVQVAVPVVVPAAKPHVVNVLVTPEAASDIVPEGVIAVPRDVSVTVTVQAEPWLITTGEAQETLVVVVRLLIVTEVLTPLLSVHFAVSLDV